jgi:hypothetical protein
MRRRVAARQAHGAGAPAAQAAGTLARAPAPGEWSMFGVRFEGALRALERALRP